MDTVEVIGIKGHHRSERLKEQLRAALNILGLKLPVREISDLDAIVNSDISATPALRINGKVIIQQIVPAIEDLVDLLSVVLVTNNKSDTMKKIIVPTDFSKTSLDAYNFAMKLAAYFKASINVVHFYSGSFSAQDPLLTIGSGKGTRENLMTRLDNFISTTSGAGEQSVATAGVSVEYDAISSLTIPALLALSAAPDTELFVMGTTGEHGLLGRLFGTVSTTVARRAECPVLLIPPGATFRGFKKILLASDYLSTDPAILEQLINLCQLFQASIHFVHVRNKNEQGDYQAVIDDIVAKLLDEQASSFSFQITSVNAASVREGLNKYMEKEAIDLCVIASAARSFIDDLFHKSLTKEMALYAKVPLMVYHVG
jgi:nucleotide-binding universal stress UspA family protein